MKKNLVFAATLLVVGSLLVVACAKKTDDATPTTKQKADDAAARNELDRAQSDIETVYNSDQYAGNQRTSAVVLPCGSVTLNTNNFTITYNGINCGSRVVSGSINVTLISGSKFSDQNAKLQVDFTNYKIHYNASGQEIVYNGTSYITNATGGTLATLFTATPDTVIHKTRGTLVLTYDTTGTGGSTFSRTWNLFRKKTFTSDGTATGIALKFEGDTTVSSGTWLPSAAGGFELVSEYGTDVKGEHFVHTIPTPFMWSNCGTTYSGPYVLKQGKVVHTADASAYLPGYVFEFAATAGYSISGTTAVPNGSCSSNAYLIEGYAKRLSDGQKLYNFSSPQQY